MLEYSIIMDADTYEEQLLATAEQFPAFINSWLVQSATLTKAEMSSRVNEGVGAEYGQGIKNNIDVDYDPENMTAVVAPNSSVPYALGLETGTKPHRPPTAEDGALAQWCELKGLNVYAVAAIIAKEGTKPHPFVQPTLLAVTDPIKQIFAEGVPVFLAQRGWL